LPDLYNAWPDAGQRPKKQDMSGEIRTSGNPRYAACMREKYIQDFGGEVGRKTYMEYIDVYERIILNK